MVKLIKREARYVAVCVLVSLVQTFFVCSRCHTPRAFAMVAFFTFMMWFLLWRGNAFINEFINARVEWIAFPVRRLFIGVVTTTVYAYCAVIFNIHLFRKVFSFDLGSSYLSTLYFSLALTIFVSLVLHAQAFFRHWRKAALEAERFRRETIAARYENLRARVNPSFMLSSLAVIRMQLAGNKELAVSSISALAGVYRHILESRDKEISTVEEDLKSLRYYVSLLEGRFGDRLAIHISAVKITGFSVPLAYQVVLEKAVDCFLDVPSHTLEVWFHFNDTYTEVRLRGWIQHDGPRQKFVAQLSPLLERYTLVSPVRPVVGEDGIDLFIHLPVVETAGAQTLVS